MKCRGDTLLHREPLPARLQLEGRGYRLVRTLKADTWAANYLLERDDGTWHVLKLARFSWLRLVVPLDVQTEHEIALYRRLAGVPGVPALTGRPCRHGFLHVWVPGAELAPGRSLPPGFFDELARLLAALHARGVAYVDLEKDENILVGDDARPWLIDFQISLARPRWLVRILQAEDLHHLAKHRHRLEPDVARDEARSARRRSPWLRLHRFLTRPYFAVRRRMQGRA